MVLSKKELDKIATEGCQVEGCDHSHGPMEEMYLVSRCHPQSGTSVSYRSKEGILSVVCRHCKRPIVDVKVAQEK
jgi:hypothetical protein